MAESFIEPSSINTIFQPVTAIIDSDGAARFNNSELSSYNFDGFIPLKNSSLLVSNLKPGMSFLPVGASAGALKTILKVEYDDPQMVSSPTSNYTISYLGTTGEIESVIYPSSSTVQVYEEDWSNKVLGDYGWVITQAGNAIFSNVAVRGRIEATEGLIDGDLIVTGSLSTSETADTTGGIVFDNSGLYAYDTSGYNTFTLDAATGEVTIFGTPGDDLLIGSDVSDAGSTVISANRITTGSVTGRVFRSNSSMTPAAGTGVYLDGSGSVRFSNANATFTFSENGLSITGGGVKIGGANPDDFITSGEVNGNVTSISGGVITTGTVSADRIDVNNLTVRSLLTRTQTNNSRIGIEPSLYFDRINFYSGLISGPGATEVTPPNVRTTYTYNGGVVKPGDQGVTISSGTNTSTTSDAAIEVLASRSTLGRSVNAYADYYNFNSVNSTFYAWNINFSGTITGNIPAPSSIDAGIITSGTLDSARIPNLAASKITSGTFDTARIPTSISITGTSGGFTAGNASNLNSGIAPAARIENLTPANFTNAQTALVIRTSDNRVGIVSSTLDIKENIIPLTGIQSNVVPEHKNGIGTSNLTINPNKIFEITPVEYSIVGESSNIKEVGFIVEDLLEKWPAAVTYDKKGLPQSYNTNSMVAGLVYAIQILKNKVDLLEKHMLELDSKKE